MARGRVSNLKKSAKKVFNKVAGSRGSERCGRSKRGARNEVCLSVAKMPGWKCGLNKITGLYACVNSEHKAHPFVRAGQTAARYQKRARRKKR